MNRFRIWDSTLGDWLPYWYTTREVARRECAKIEQANGTGKSLKARRTPKTDRYRVIDRKRKDYDL